MSDEIQWQRLRAAYEAHIKAHNATRATTLRCTLCGLLLSQINLECPADEGKIEWENRETLQEMLDL